MRPDGELLRRYTETHSESAFTELVERHLALVYSAALRQVNGDAHLAQDVAQTVFAALARKAAALAGRPVLTGWLYTSAHFAAVKAVRAERRRHTHEEEAQFMNQLLGDPAPDLDWERLRPVLDAVMLELNETDREAVLLRYFDNRPHAEIADRLGLSENAARMRVERALDKLHALLSSRGVSTTAALSAVISVHAVQAAPAGLAATLSTTALAGTFATAAIATHTTMNWINIKSLSAILAAAIAAGTGTHLVQQREVNRLRFEKENLTAQQAKLTSERDYATQLLAVLRDDNERLNRNTAELLRLRGETTRLRREMAALSSTAANTASIEAPATPTNARVTQVNVASRFMVGPADVFANLGLPKDGATEVLTDVQYEVLQKTLEKSEGVQIFAAPQVVIFGGREAQVEAVNPATADGSAWETVSTLGITPTVGADGITINLGVRGRLWEWKPRLKDAVIANNPSLSGADQLTSAVIRDGQTVAISKKLAPAATPNSPASASEQLLVVFVTPTLIDAAGNRLHVQEAIEELTAPNRK